MLHGVVLVESTMLYGVMPMCCMVLRSGGVIETWRG